MINGPRKSAVQEVATLLIGLNTMVIFYLHYKVAQICVVYALTLMKFLHFKSFNQILFNYAHMLLGNLFSVTQLC